MPSSSATASVPPASPCRTHAKNATQHLGQIVLEAQTKKCTSAEEQADDQRTKDAKATQAAALQPGYKHLGEMESTMEVAQATTAAARPKPVRPKVFKKKDTVTVNEPVSEAMSAAGEVTTSNSLICQADEGKAVGNAKALKKSTNMRLREDISHARTPKNHDLHDGSACGSMLKQGTDRTNKKTSLAGKINNWASVVEASSKGSFSQGPGSMLIQSTSTNSNVPPPSTQTRTTSSICTKVTTTSSQAYSVPLSTPTGTFKFQPVPNVNIAGGFGDDEQDDSQERESAMQPSNPKQGQVIDFVMNDDSNIEFDDSISNAVQEGGTLKHKHAVDDEDYVTSSEVENTGDEDVELEDENTKNNMPDVVMEGPRVMTKTSVTVLNIPGMKVKTEQPLISRKTALSAHSSLSTISTPSDMIDDQH
ncbi:hypothetical protein PAXRUDRAFT_15185 [Paxillus rubicundulus Ve08.2h10]|uniref:Unplaced genomic scaffold scaffold_956, whole genome shotgun sequence n=1 Tax=Paxillus rubicundulus Ve08.2h10 TaxID=930991 RepID=A0A0D0DBS8_9AGAM|nr:hypothetical protein PAXRUDRAFT_15185 [Paxillus rubicundulus Ve08.2h10]